jgi:outer membrane autotransporter protein
LPPTSGPPPADSSYRGDFSSIQVVGSGSTFTAAGVLEPVLNVQFHTPSPAYFTYTPPITTAFTVVQAAGGVKGSFASLTQPTAQLAPGTRFDALYTANAITLVVTPADYTNLTALGQTALDANQTQVGVGLNAMRGAAGVRNDPAATSALAALYQRAPAALPAVLNSLQGVIYGDVLASAIKRGRSFQDEVFERLDSFDDGASSVPSAGGRETSVWALGRGERTWVGSEGQSGYNDLFGGIAGGVDHAFAPGFRAGLAFDYTDGDVVSPITAASTKLSMFDAVAYADYRLGSAFLDGQVGVNYVHQDVRRTLSVVSDVANAAPTGVDFHLAAEAGKSYKTGGLSLTPDVGVFVDQVRRDSVTEQSAGAFSLAVGAAHLTSVQTHLGARAETSMSVGGGYSLAFIGKAYWGHELGDTINDTTAQFTAGFTPATMTFQSAPLGRDLVNGGVGVSLKSSKGLQFFLNATGEDRRNEKSVSAVGGVSLSW